MGDCTRFYPISHYGRRPTFSSFLPGVAGERGIPLWCFYVNRGQCVAGFGSRDKNHSIMEFSPANIAYQRVQTQGFRTLIKLNGSVLEPFSDGLGNMDIAENALRLSWESEAYALRMRVSYFLVPGMKLGMLARRVHITSTAKEERDLEVLDGLAAIVPFGLSQQELKMMGQTAKAWMMTEGVSECMPYFRLRTSVSDTTSVAPIEDGSFGVGCAGGKLLPVLVDPAVVFSWDTSLASPIGFQSTPLADLLSRPQRMENELPCCLFAWMGKLKPGQTLCLESVYGLSHGRDAIASAAKTLLLQLGLAQKEEEALSLLDPYLDAIRTHTANPLFDRYCSQSYLDNFLRGGVAHLFESDGRSQLFYLFSRKHGDLERDYNDFVVTPEYASQGNGNYRDVLQNRRVDVRFCPKAGWEPLKPFLELIQADGYNPLVLLPVTYILAEPEVFDRRLLPLLCKPFTPGALMRELERLELPAALTAKILCAATPMVNAGFGEGYWVDHWVYLLDMLESYLSVYPDQKQVLLHERCLRWFASRASVRPLAQRCVLEKNTLRQHNALRPIIPAQEWLCSADGEIVLSTPLEKLFFLCIIKFAALDASGEGISMEAGKPGWYDALNGLPGLFGSSTAESCELWRLLRFVRESLSSCETPLQLPAEMIALAQKLADIALLPDALERYQHATSALESYRAGGCTVMEVLSGSQATAIVKSLEMCISASINDLLDRMCGAFPTYFTNIPSKWEMNADGILPTQYTHQPLPPFLEGPMHVLRLPVDGAHKRMIVDWVRSGPLYDKKLQMYKVSADLSGETPEIGRANGFTRGWLEHESIWLHMEYKYLLELLKNGFYDRFFEDFSNVLIPFQPPERYGRSVLENCSFLASSANPDPSTHGRGFVARLSGATAEFLDIWQTLFFGVAPFIQGASGLTLRLSPTIPKRLIPADGCVSAMFLGHTLVTYHLPACEAVTPDTHRVVRYRLSNGMQTHIVQAETLDAPDAAAVRDGLFTSIDVELAHR